MVTFQTDIVLKNSVLSHQSILYTALDSISLYKRVEELIFSSQFSLFFSLLREAKITVLPKKVLKFVLGIRKGEKKQRPVGGGGD